MFVQLDRNGTVPIRKQLYDALTGSILSGALQSGEKLPSTREMSDKLGVARNTIVEIYEQLISESYLTTFPGRGTFVAPQQEHAPHGWTRSEPAWWEQAARADMPLLSTTWAARASGALRESGPADVIAFAGGMPDLETFPRKAWLRALRESLIFADTSLFGYGDVMGYFPLRLSLAEHLAKYKGIRCSPYQIVLVNGTADAILLCALMFRQEHRTLMVETPVIDFVPEIFRMLSYPLFPLAVDDEGIRTERLPDRSGDLIFCSPSHQFPLGGTLSIGRRLQLTDYVRRNRHFLIEDDYSSEFRYAGAQVNSLAQLAPDHVIHLGTFSKTLAPFLRLGYMVVPESLVPAVKQCQTLLSRRVGTLEQMALNVLIEQGSYTRHVLAVGKRYKRKMQCLVGALQEAFGDEVRILGSHAGLHVAVTFSGISFSPKTDAVLAHHGVCAERLAEYAVVPEALPGGHAGARPHADPRFWEFGCAEDSGRRPPPEGSR